ncbi:MAG: Crp/Fnr family transcriptional regulator [Candidatus Korobacteraceae bacterium]|jgi:CRP/FNR family transcriptional regulator
MPTSTRDFEKTLRGAPLFAGLTDAQFNVLASRLVERNFNAGEMIFQEGQPCAGMFIIQSGSVRIFKNSSTGREQVLSIEGAGASIAELPVFDGGAYPASSQTLVRSSLLFLSKQDFHALCMRHPEVSLKVLAKVGARLRQLVGIIEDLSFTTVRHRLAALLLRMARAEGRQTPAGTEIVLAASNQDIAAQIGTVRELVSRNLSRFQSEGLLHLDGRTVLIPNLDRLEQEIGEP